MEFSAKIFNFLLKEYEQQETLEMLRDRHKILVYVIPEVKLTGVWNYQITHIRNGNYNYLVTDYIDYNDALKAGIKHALTLI